MKSKALAALALAIIAAFALCSVGCGSVDDGYDNAKSELIEKIDTMNNASNEVSAVEIKTWNATGADYFTDFMTKMLTSTTYQQYLDNFENAGSRRSKPNRTDYEEWEDEIIGTTLRRAQSQNQTAVDKQCNIAFAFMEQFRNNYTLVGSLNDELTQEIKDFKDKYQDRHATSVDAIADYYLESSNYADSVIHPSGSYLTFSASVQNSKNSIESLKKVVDLKS